MVKEYPLEQIFPSLKLSDRLKVNGEYIVLARDEEKANLFGLEFPWFEGFVAQPTVILNLNEMVCGFGYKIHFYYSGDEKQCEVLNKELEKIAKKYSLFVKIGLASFGGGRCTYYIEIEGLFEDLYNATGHKYDWRFLRYV